MAEEVTCPNCKASIDDVVNDEKTKQSNLKDLYKRYCDCRDQELDRFWKNSTYVWIFLAVCFGAFGQVILKYFELEQNTSKYFFDLKKHTKPCCLSYHLLDYYVLLFGYGWLAE